MSDHSHDAPASYWSYLIGFVLAVILTVIPFWIVMAEVNISLAWALFIIFTLGILQIMVHIYYFMHVTLGAEDGWQVMSLIFTGIILIIILAGSIWVLLNLQENMMPAHEVIERARNLP